MKTLKQAVKNTKKVLPITFEYNESKIIGYIRDLKYKNGKAYTIIKLNDDERILLKDKIIRLAYRVDKIIFRKKYKTAKKLSIEFCGLIDKCNDGERGRR